MSILHELCPEGINKGNIRGTKGGTLGYRGRIFGNHYSGLGKILSQRARAGENLHPEFGGPNSFIYYKTLQHVNACVCLSVLDVIYSCLVWLIFCSCARI